MNLSWGGVKRADEEGVIKALIQGLLVHVFGGKIAFI